MSGDPGDAATSLRGRTRRAWSHPARHVVQNLALRLPPLRWTARRFHRTGAMDNPDVVVDRAARVVEAGRRGGLSVDGRHLVEVGPGHTLGVGVCLLLAGAARLDAIDTVRYARSAPDAESVRDLWRRSVEAGLMDATATDPDASPADAIERLEYQVIGGGEPWPLPSGERDIVYSFSVLEHVRDLRRVVGESHRVLRPGGLSIHEIDLRDHYNLGPEEDWLAFLRFDDRQWDRMTSARSAWCNRMRAPELRSAFAELFELVEFDEQTATLPAGFDHEAIAPRFRRFDADELSIASVWVVARKQK
jgi:SAM-dependent methyltransferase